MRAWRIGLGMGVLVILGLLAWRAPGNRQALPRGPGAGALTGLVADGRPLHTAADGAAATPPSPFTVGSRTATSAAFPWLRDEQLSDGRRFLHVDIARLNALQVGSGFEVDVAGEGRLQLALVEAEHRIEDVRRLTGSWWDAGGREHAFGLSLSSDGRYVAGSFDAGDGQRVMEALDDAGWIQEAGRAMVSVDEHGPQPL